MISVQRFRREDAQLWNAFVANSVNGTFLFDRGFMDYHADRFDDHSLIFLREGKCLGLLPADLADGVLRSHGGLTYGGIVVAPRTGAGTVLEMFDALMLYAKHNGISKIVYKPVPTMYHTIPTEHDRYALFRHDALLARSDLSTAVWLAAPQKISTSRRQSARRAAKGEIMVHHATDWARFWVLLTEVLDEHHNVTPTHSLEETTTLAARFPQKIKLYIAAPPDGSIQAGAVVFDCGDTVHAQYLAASRLGRETGALNAVIIALLEQHFHDRRWFDFGISTEQAGQILNTGLLEQKEMFGGTTQTYEQFHVSI